MERLPQRKNGELYITDLIGIAAGEGERVESIAPENPQEALGINDRVQLAQAEAIVQERLREQWMRLGVSLIDPPSILIDASVEIEEDTVIHPHTILKGVTRIGRECQIGPQSIIVDSLIGHRCKIQASMVEGSTLEEGVEVGPFSHIRPGSYLETEVHIGNFAEVKKSRLGRGTKVGHFSYLGDATLGQQVNIGAGTVTCNFDGFRKHQTIIGDGAFIGSDSMLVAPVEIGRGASTGAGSVVNRDVPPDSMVVGAPARIRNKRKQKD